MNKKVSVIIPCYNQSLYIADTILSVVNQTYTNIEIICIDDCSNDDSVQIIKSFAEKYENIVILTNRENSGVVKSRNKAIAASTGQYILPLDGDDVIFTSYIEKAVDILERNPNIGICYCRACFIGDKSGEWLLPKFDADKLLYSNHIFATALFRKSDFILAGGYKDYMKDGFEDWDLWLSFIENGVSVYKINEILFGYRQKAVSRSSYANKKDMELREVMLKHHPKLYLKSYLQHIEKYNNKIKKYKILLIECIFLVILLLYLVIYNTTCVPIIIL